MKSMKTNTFDLVHEKDVTNNLLPDIQTEITKLPYIPLNITVICVKIENSFVNASAKMNFNSDPRVYDLEDGGEVSGDGHLPW